MDKQESTRNTELPSKIEVHVDKRGKTFRLGSEPLPRPYHIADNPPECVAGNEVERLLKYIKVEPRTGVESFATVQEFQNFCDAETHWNTQNSYNEKYLIHPSECKKYQDKYMLIFEEVIRDFNGGWINNKQAAYSSEDMWKIMKKIGKNLRYLLTEVAGSMKRPHGNLRDGVGITPELETLFLNLGVVIDQARKLYEDISDLHGFLKTIVPSLSNESIKGRANRWMTFLSEGWLQVPADSSIIASSDIHPAYHSFNHIRLIVNYPSSWDNVDDEVEFLANMHLLCTHKSTFNLLNNATFTGYLENCYPQWNDCFTTGKNKGCLNEVYKYGVGSGIYVDSNTGVLCVPTIVIFAHACITHYEQKAIEYNIQNKCELVTRAGHMDPYLTAAEILAELDKEFPCLIDNIYGAYYKAIARGYKHPDNSSIEEILPGFFLQ